MLSIPFILLCVLSYLNNRDIFSLSKVYLAVFFVFFGEAIFSFDKGAYFYILVSMLLVFAIVILAFERLGFSVPLGEGNRKCKRISKSEVSRLWILTLIPVLSQFYFIIEMGGIVSYISGVGSRVSLWKGFGVFLLLIKLINIINYIYFIKIINSNPSKNHKLLFLLNFTIFIGLSLLSGSRSMLLWNIVFMGVYYHYVVNRINITKATSLFFSVVVVAMVLGVMRDGYSMDDTGFQAGVSVEDKVLNMSNFTYGTKPIYLLLEKEEITQLSYGKTYLTVFTNLIPRALWPGKPDPGGIVFTRDILNDPFEGNSYYSTGIIGEAFINFGYAFGVLFFMIQLFIMYFMMFYYVRKLTLKNIIEKNPESFGVYPFLLFGLPAYLYAEFTTNTLSVFFFKVLIFHFVLFFVNGKLKNE